MQPTNWDSLRKGLTAGDLLYQQLRQMEAAHIAANERELEMTKHISLLQLDPAALLTLRQTGACEFHVPEVLYALDFPGQYFRRLKSVRVSIPCVAGPYGNVSATLSLTASWTRRTATLSDASQPESNEAMSPQIAIAISSGREDGGVFELDFNDPRYLPFEGGGAISSWRLTLPTTVRPFDYSSISDVVMHVSYTARDAGESFSAEVSAGLVDAMNELKALVPGDGAMSRLFSLRQEFPTAWNQLVSAGDTEIRTCTLELSKRHFPAFLGHAWMPSPTGTGLEPQPIALDVKKLSAYLSPRVRCRSMRLASS